jgi:hypothetical protein
MLKSLKTGVAAATLAGAVIGSFVVPAASQAAAAECTASNLSIGGQAKCLHSKARVWFYCRRAANGTRYEVDGPAAAAANKWSVAYCISGDLRDGNAQWSANA